MRWQAAAAGTALILAGCAAKQVIPAAPPLPVASEARLKVAAPPPPSGAEILAAQPAEVRQAVKLHEQNGRWPVYKTSEVMLYPYGEGTEPVVDCAPLRTTDIQLGAGETVTDLALGDAERWMATPASSGDPRNPTPHIALKPQAAAIETNLTIYTTRRIYHVILRSRGRAMQEVQFYYPEDLIAAMARADAAAAQARQAAAAGEATDSGGGDEVITAVDPAQLNFAYTIGGANVPWRPRRVYDDGTHVFIEMPPSMRKGEAPALLIGAGGGTQMVNYRVRGNYFVVDRLFDKGVLLAGVGREQDRVTIAYAGEAR